MSQPPETTLWSGTSSQLKNFWPFVSCLLILPIPWAIWRWLETKNHVYRLTTERLVVETGVFGRHTETLELYRVRDLQVTQPFLLRMFGLQNIKLLTSDTSTPEQVIDHIPAELNLPDQFRKQIEIARDRKRVRDIDVTDFS
jgi:uncharacterized membrane protein YdbT with pleckstrin-like domain